MWFKSEIFIIFLISINSVKSQYNATAYEIQLSQLAQGLVNEETRIIKMTKDLIILINSTSVSLNSSSNAGSYTNLIQSLNKLSEILILKSTVNDYEDCNCTNICDDVNIQITTIDFHIRLYYAIIAKISSNLTEVYAQNCLTYYHYSLQYYKLIPGTALQQSVNQIVLDTNKFVIEYYNYISLLTIDITSEYNIGINLYYYRNKFCKCSINVTTSVANLIENVDYVESPLVCMETKMNSTTVDALTKVQNAISSVNNTSFTLLISLLRSSLKFLTDMSAIDDYSVEPWTNVTTCSEINNKIAYVSYKYRNYGKILSSTSRNWSLAVYYQSYLNVYVNLYKLNNNQSSSVQAAILPIIDLQNQLYAYSSQLSYSINKMSLYSYGIKVLGDKFCSCDDGNLN